MTDGCPHPEDMLVLGLAGVAICADCWGAPKTAPTLRSVPLDDDTARAIGRAAKRAKDATNVRDALIVNAVNEGAGVREVARAAGMNHTSVLHILKRDQP